MERITVLGIQEILFTEKFMHEAPTDSWTAAAVNGYSAYLQSLGVPYPSYTMLPNRLEDLPVSLRRKLELRRSIRFTTNGE